MSIRYAPRLGPAQIQEALRPFKVAVTEKLAGQVATYIELLLLWNQKVNLTSVTQPAEILTRHFGESFFAAAVAGIRKGRLADVGSGAGFPGLALKLLRPQLHVALIEPSLKKSAFLAEVARRLELSEVEVLRARFNQISPAEFMADWVTARAIGGYSDLLSWASNVLSAGRLVLWLGKDTVNELSSIPGWKFDRPVAIPHSRERVLLVGRPVEEFARESQP